MFQQGNTAVVHQLSELKGDNMPKKRLKKYFKSHGLIWSMADMPTADIENQFKYCTVFLKNGNTLMGALCGGTIFTRGRTNTGATLFKSIQSIEKAAGNGKANVIFTSNGIQQTRFLPVSATEPDIFEWKEYLIDIKSEDSPLVKTFLQSRNETFSFLDVGWLNYGIPVYSVHHLYHPASDVSGIEMLGTMVLSFKNKDSLGTVFLDMIDRCDTLDTSVTTDMPFMGYMYMTEETLKSAGGNIHDQRNIPIYGYNRYSLSMLPRLATNIDKLLEELQMGTLKQPFLISLEPQDIFTVEKYYAVVRSGKESLTKAEFDKSTEVLACKFPIENYLTESEVMEIKKKADYFNKEILKRI